MSALELRGLTRRYGDAIALDALDLSVEEGDFCVLLGPSGCGKSTALRLVAGLERPSAGTVLIDGRPVNDLPPRARDVAFVFQTYALYPHMSVARNLAFPLKVRGFARAAREQRVRETARLLRIENLLDRRPRQLSGGQRQRVAIGRAIVRRPRLFLFDEPLSNLDARLRGEMREEIARLHRRLGATMVYVTHDQVEAMTLGRRVAVLNDGRLEQVGTPADIYARPATRFVASFVGTPPMNFVEGRVSGGVFRAGGLAVPLAGAREGPCELGVRPEHVRFGGAHGRGRVAWVEDHGADRYAHLDGKGFRLVARLGRTDPCREGDDVAFGFDEERLHAFPSRPARD